MLLDNDLLLWIVVSQVERPECNEEDLTAMKVALRLRLPLQQTQLNFRQPSFGIQRKITIHHPVIK